MSIATLFADLRNAVSVGYANPADASIMTPAECVIETFGGVRAAAREIQVAPSTVCRWAKTEPGCGGRVPKEFHEPLLTAASRLGLWLDVDLLTMGGMPVACTFGGDRFGSMLQMLVKG